MVNIRNRYMQAIKRHNTTINLIRQGVEGQDSNLIEQVTIEPFTGTSIQLLNETIDLLNEFILAHPPQGYWK